MNVFQLLELAQSWDACGDAIVWLRTFDPEMHLSAAMLEDVPDPSWFLWLESKMIQKMDHRRACEYLTATIPVRREFDVTVLSLQAERDDAIYACKVRYDDRLRNSWGGGMSLIREREEEIDHYRDEFRSGVNAAGKALINAILPEFVRAFSQFMEEYDGCN